MLDKYVVPKLRQPLAKVASLLYQRGVRADAVTLLGFGVGLASVLAVAYEAMTLAIVLLLLGRLADGLDGELARQAKPTDAGAFLDIVLDFIFYALFPIGFALQDPANNALPAAVLVASFVGTGASFLAFAGQADKHGGKPMQFDYKGLSYLDGLAEGTETIAAFVLMCLFPQHFATIAWVFAAICAITTLNRVVFGYRSLQKLSGPSP